MAIAVPRAPAHPVLDLAYLRLAPGDHESEADGACVMEAVSVVAGERWSSAPSCVSPLIRRFLTRWNDTLPRDARQQLKRFICPVIGTRGSATDEANREWMVRDWLTRVCAPAWLRCTGRDALAGSLDELTTVGPRTAHVAHDLLADARSAIVECALSDGRRSMVRAAHQTGWSAAQAALNAEDHLGRVDPDRQLTLDVVLLAMAAASKQNVSSTVFELCTSAHGLVQQLCDVGRPDRARCAA